MAADLFELEGGLFLCVQVTKWLPMCLNELEEKFCSDYPTVCVQVMKWLGLGVGQCDWGGATPGIGTV